MKNKAYDLSSYSFNFGEKVLIDANIWLYLFPAPANPTRKASGKYSKAFGNLIAAKSQPILDCLVLSEYLNRYCRIEWNGNFKSKYPDYKKFRNSPDSTSIVSDAYYFAKQILKYCKIHSIAANNLDINQILTDFATAKVDFNDAVLVDICKKEGLKLMTNDGDFEYGGIEVLTTNSKLLSKCN